MINSGMFKPWLSEFVILSRAYTKDMAHFCVLHATPRVEGDHAPINVDRLPVLMCCGKGLLHWLLSDAYLGENGNAYTRHAASSHAQVYVLVGNRTPSLVDALATDIESGKAA